MKLEQIEEAERQLDEIKANAPDWTNPFWTDHMMPFLTRRREGIIAKMTIAKPEEMTLLQGHLQAIESLRNEPEKQAEYDKMVRAELAKYKPKDEEKTDGPGRSSSWAANAGRRFARR